MQLRFAVIGLNEYKIGPNTSINNTSLPGYAFYFDETESTHGGTGILVYSAQWP